ncbi:FAD-dependent monooxygenase [Streptomyces iakyrus]|uniref:FAD-dependent monooxygenase n=1 Tax=Streptomyces iakyrus TaxID=68219 RepID=UPI0005266A17|nr:FAD-dependent monooxygenase [Streptomyces iakyrus]
MTPVLIAGGGIGGLTAALSLHAAGIDAVVVESARRIEPLGVGMNLLPHGVRELMELGLGDDLADIGVATGEHMFCDSAGDELFTEPRGLAQGYRWPQYSVHRGELHLMLLERVRERLGPDAVRTGTRLLDFADGPDSVRVRVTDRATDAVETLDAEALIGADGLHSTVRAQLHPDEGPLSWSGQRMWRGVTEGVPPFLTGRSMVIAHDGTASLVAYPIGRDRTNWVCLVRVGEPGPLPEDGTVDAVDDHRAGQLKEVLAHYEGWSLGWLDVPELLERSDRILEYPMVDREPLAAWGRGRVTLLGDAAHPMYPAGANGASQAVLDARVLAYELAQADGDTVSALAAYERTRLPASSEVVQAGRMMERAGGMLLNREQLTFITEMYRQKADGEVTELNARPSLTPPGRS